METSLSFSVRSATIEDVPTLVNLGAKTFLDTFAMHNTEENMKLYVDKTFTNDQITKEVTDPATMFLIAYDGDTNVGYAKMKMGEIPAGIDSTKAIEIERIYSTQEYVGKRVGQSLMQACINIAKGQGCEVIWLGVWEHNPRAIAFYEKWGFKKFGSHPFLLGTDLQTDLLMKKNLKQ
jgi:ribosomal protein S18 acetylase RimI-like enzyme